MAVCCVREWRGGGWRGRAAATRADTRTHAHAKTPFDPSLSHFAAGPLPFRSLARARQNARAAAASSASPRRRAGVTSVFGRACVRACSVLCRWRPRGAPPPPRAFTSCALRCARRARPARARGAWRRARALLRGRAAGWRRRGRRRRAREGQRGAAGATPGGAHARERACARRAAQPQGLRRRAAPQRARSRRRRRARRLRAAPRGSCRQASRAKSHAHFRA
jgi:hypothetical protein